VTNAATGILVPPDDANALAAAMHRVATEPALAPYLSQAAFLAVGEHLNAVRQSEVLETILLQAAEQR
jgi:glycosyltransferase involved in cell wall biosynthesis